MSIVKKEEETTAVITAASDAKATTPPAKKKRKRASKPRPKKTPLELKAEPLPDAFSMKKKIYAIQSDVKKFTVPKNLRKTLRSITGHKSVIEDTAVLQEVQELYKKAVDYEAIIYMANCLLYYEEHHNIEFKKKDVNLIERALKRTMRVPFDKMLDIFKNYICGMESLHRYYGRYLRSGACKKVKRERPVKVKKVAKQLPYNLFIKESWKSRKTEFNTITKESGISSVMKKLSVEWKGNPELKTKYREMADKLNSEKAAAVASAAATNKTEAAVVESAV
jgi:hypothetical protein